MIVCLGFLLLVSLLLSARLSALGDWIQTFMPGATAVLRLMDLTLSLVLITVLLAAIFKIMPDVEIRWRHVWVGAAMTTLLFVAGKFAIGFYLGRSDVVQGYGAAGAIALVLIWIYYSSMIVLFGAEFTEVWAAAHGSGIQPEPGAARTITREERLPDPRPES
jgi:membrane protein